MKKLLLLLAVLLIPITRATTYNCTEVGQQIIVPDCVCTPTGCPECPEPWNITIENITVPNITCMYDTSGFAESVQGCVDSLGTCRDNLQSCDNRITTQAYQNQSLLRCQQELSTTKTQVKTTEETWRNYTIGALILGLVGSWWYFKEKQKPSGIDYKRQRE